MAIVGREVWMRQQERIQAMDTARNIPSSITASRLLRMASQMSAILHQLELANASVEDDARMLENMIAAFNREETSSSSTTSSISKDVTVAVAVALLLRMWTAGTFLENNGQSNEELGIWNTWKAKSPRRGLAAIEKVGWENWISLLLPWLLPGRQALTLVLLPCSTSPHLIRFLSTSLAHHAEHALLSTRPRDAISAMKGLDAYLLESSSGFYSCSDAPAVFGGLEKVLDSWLGGYRKQPVGDDSEEVFQTACQLRTRLALCFPASNFSTSELEDERRSIDNEGGGTIKSKSRVDIEIEEAKAIWQQILYLKPPVSHKVKPGGVSGGASPSSDNRFAIGLAAHIAVSALFLEDTTTSRLPFAHNTQKTSNIFTDPDPTSPARVTLAAITVLEQAALATQSECRATGSVSEDEKEKNRPTIPLLYTQSLEFLPSLIWTISSLVPRMDQKQELLEIFLGTSASSTADIMMFPAARTLLESGTNCTTVLSFHQWALKETIALSNLVRTDEEFSKIKVLGEEEPGVDNAVHAVFPAALLCPGILLKVLVGDAAGQRGKAMLFAGILQQLPTLRSVVKTSLNSQSMMNSQPLLLELLKNRLEASATASLNEGQRSALQHCIVILCSYSTIDPISSSSSAPSTSSDAFSTSTAPAVSPHQMLEFGVLPALNCAAATPVESAEDVAMLLKLSRLLLELSMASSCAISSLKTVCSQLSSVSFKFLEFSSRRIDLNALCLLLPRAVIEEAYAISQLCGTYTSSSLCNLSKPLQPRGSGNSGVSSAGTIWEKIDALCDSLAVCIASNDRETGHNALSKALDGIEPSQFKDALAVAAAVMLACLAAEEASKLYFWLIEAVYYTLLKTGETAISTSTFCLRTQSKREEEGSNTLVLGLILQGAVIELLCRAVHAVAFVPGLIPIAGEEKPIGSTPSQLRCRAVARLLQHVSLASQAAVDKAASAPALIKGALITRIFKELSRCAASITEYYDVSTLHVCLMQVVHVMKQEMANKLKLSLEMKNDITASAEKVKDPALIATVAAVLD